MRTCSAAFAGGIALLAACGPPRDAATTSPPGTPPVVTAKGELTLPSGVDSLLRHADSVFPRAPDSAATLYRIALGRAQAAADSAGIARSLTGLGQTARLAGDFPGSREWGEQALALKLRRGMRADLFRSYNALGLLARAEERLSDASALFASAQAAARATNDSVALAKVEVNSGLVLVDLGDFDGARAALLAGRDGARAVADTATLGKALNNLAALDITLGNPLPAVATLEAARSLFRAAGDSIGEVNALGQVAVAYDALGEPQRAFAALDSALDMAQRLGMRVEEAEDLKILAGLYRDAGYYQHALEAYARARVLNDSLEQPEERGDLLREEAQVYFVLGGLTKARARAAEALRVHQAGGYRYAEFADHLVLAELAQRATHSVEAQAHLRSAGLLASSLAAPAASAQVALSEARVADESGQPDRVLRVLDDARGVIAQTGSGAMAEAFALEARSYARLGKLDAAVEAGRQAVTAVERVRSNYASGELRTSYASKRAAVYADLVVVLLRLGRSAEAFEIADAARGHALLEHLASARNDVRQPSGAARDLADAEALLRRIDELMAKLQSRQQKAPRERTTGYVETTKELDDRLHRARGEYEEMLARRPHDAAALIGGGRADRRAVQGSLEPGEILLEYFVTPARLYIFAVTPTSLTSLTTEVTADDLAARVRLARELVAGRAADDVRARRVLAALHTLLLRPVQTSGALRGVRRIIVVPHEVLTYLPLAALVDSATGRYVAEDYAVVHVPSAASLPVLRAAARRAAVTPRAAAAVFAPFPDALPATSAEAQSFRASIPGAVVHVGPDATERRLRSALESGAIVHVATHGIMNARNPLFSRLELARGDGDSTADNDNGRLEVHELLDLHARSPLIFLSGCETGLGASWSTHYETGQDYTTIAQALLFAGAPNVVATLWRIDDEGAADFARRFYSARRTLGAPEALAQAQRGMIADPRWRSPYLWAAYEVSGGGIAGIRSSKPD